jgi:hypothetical protein
MTMSHRFALPIAILLAAFLIPSLLGNITVKGNVASNIAIQSNGTISYTSTMLLGVGHPSYAYDRNGNLVNIQALVNLVADSGGNCWREAMGVTYTVDAYFANLKSYCDQRGVKFMIQTLASSVDYMTPQEELDIINNNNGKQAPWINGWGSIIQQLQPHSIMVMNEPSNGGTYTTASATAFGYYRQFCINCINAWRQIKPDLVIIVQNDPMNDEFDSTSYGFAANPLPFSNIIYGRHIYYAYDGNYPPNYLPDQQAYWNAKTPQDLANAKQLLTNFIDGESSALRNKGQQVMWDEWGANSGGKVPNALQYEHDFLELCKARNIGVLHYDIVPYSYENTGLLNEDYLTLNAIGQVWASEMSSS